MDQMLKYGSCVMSGTAGGRNGACANNVAANNMERYFITR